MGEAAQTESRQGWVEIPKDDPEVAGLVSEFRELVEAANALNEDLKMSAPFLLAVYKKGNEFAAQVECTASGSSEVSKVKELAQQAGFIRVAVNDTYDY